MHFLGNTNFFDISVYEFLTFLLLKERTKSDETKRHVTEFIYYWHKTTFVITPPKKVKKNEHREKEKQILFED